VKKIMFIVALATIGCASPAKDYVLAEQSAWAQFDKGGMLDRWIDQDATLSHDVKDALHQLNVGRRARIAHAVAAVNS